MLAQGTPQDIKARVPGSVLSVRGVDIHRAERALQGLDGLIDIQTYGDQLNLIVNGDAAQLQAETSRRLEQAGVAGAVFDTLPVSMEEAFIYLVSAAKGKRS